MEPETWEVEDEDDEEVESKGVGEVCARFALRLGSDASEQREKCWRKEEGERVELIEQTVEGCDDVLTAIHSSLPAPRARPAAFLTCSRPARPARHATPPRARPQSAPRASPRS